MTVSTELSHEEYVGNGVTTDFDFRFRIFESKHLIVVVADSEGNETTLKNGTDYTIVGAGSYHGGKVVLNKPLAQGWKILLERDLPVVQETDLRNQGKFFAEVHEDAFDYLTMLIQKALGTFSLSLRKPTYLSNYYDAKGNRIANLAPPKFGSDSANKDYVDNSIKDIDSKTLRVKDKPINALPNTEQRANKILAFDDNGQPITVLPESGSASDVLIELGKPIGASLVGTESGKTVQEVFSEPESNYIKSVKCRLPMYFNGYDDALNKIKSETDGKGSINPDGMSIDEDGNYFISCPTSISNMKSASSLVIVYSKKGETLTYFWMPPLTSTLSFRVDGSLSKGWKIFGRSLNSLDTNYGVSSLIYWEISSLPIKDEVLDISNATITNFPVGQLFDIKDNYVISVITRKALAAATFCRVSVFDIDKQRIIAEFFIPKTMIAYDTQTAWVDNVQYSVSEIYKNTWKIQDFAYNHLKNTFVFSVGGVYQKDHPSNGNPDDTYHDIGVFEVNTHGELCRSSVVKVDGLIKEIGTPLLSGGKLEMEGVAVTNDGVMSCAVYNTTTDIKNAEYLIIKEFDKNSKDQLSLVKHASKHGIFRGLNYDGLVGASGRTLNPITHLPFANINDVLDSMVFLDIPKISFQLKNEMELFENIRLLKNLLNTTAKVEIESLNAGSRFLLSVKSSLTTLTSFYIYGTVKNWSLQRIPTISHGLKLTQAGTITSTSDNLGDMGVLSSNITSSNRTVTIGDSHKYEGAGDSDYHSPNRIFFEVSKSYSDVNSRMSFSIQYSSITPGVDSDISLGSASNKWKDIYATNSAIITSDSRRKTKIQPIESIEENTARMLKSLIKKYKMKDAVSEKKENARWHFGVIAQDIIEVFSKNGLDALDYGIICYDEWEEEGKLKNSYAVRYDELMCFIISSL
ncbi:tail fiber domain-containing protein [Proteus sp. G2673]|uniref:tail fiber domain-containing protein n=1 Tax=Proteus sp. G2673 TaxID=2698885 RepID=UPI001377AEAB|nr:tail fiber domain-containing protein [Proteus sp. G2673]NBL91646.1 hypothetical protein [Proteus sp. G2673]